MCIRDSNSTISADINGNATTATTLKNTKTIAGKSFNGSQNVTIASTNLSDNSSLVKTSGAQNIGGKKTFTDYVIVNQRMGIGTPDPSVPLYVQSSINMSTWFGYVNAFQLNFSSPNNLTNSTSIASGAGITCFGNIAVASDSRIKRNIREISDNESLNILNKLKPKRYGYNDIFTRGTNEVLGFIAQEVQEVIPIAVSIIPSYIPNIYQRATVSGEILTFSTDLSLSSSSDVSRGKLKIRDKDNK